MILEIILLLIHSCFAFDLPRDCCGHDLKINEDRFNVTDTFHIGDVYPTDAHYDVYGNLFYVESGRNDEGFFFNINIIRFKSKSSQKIKGLPKGLSYSIAVDKKNTKVYFGTGKGIYTYSYETHSASPITSSAVKLDMIFVDKDSNKYITEHNNGLEELYRLDGDKKTRLRTPETLNELAIDDKNNFYYIAQERLCVLKVNETRPDCISRVNYDGIAQISVHNDHVFVASKNLTYFSINEKDLRNADNLPGQVTAIAFDNKGNFVLGIQGKLLKYEKNDECNIREDNGNKPSEQLKRHPF
ncbi:uncharacterized protein LOC114365631 [Ostrinia furnacalis]|uniref:uncharacterized protein LOC114365631 n=1 Tax=Ostrinia furnacalis TaxID=93504 RepID=UPI00103BE363|nr:uncharacterized protein LOC114365631 [Ostrinia furnacalis]